MRFKPRMNTNEHQYVIPLARAACLNKRDLGKASSKAAHITGSPLFERFWRNAAGMTVEVRS